MADNEETEIKKINVNVQKSIILNAIDILYHDVVTVHNDPMYYVYTLGNENMGGTHYALVPTVRMATFINKQDADMYHNAVQNIMDYQKTQKFYETLRKWIAEDIEKFRNDITSMKKTVSR